MLAEVAARSPSDAAGFQRLGRRISGIFDAFYPYTERPMMRPQVMLAMLPYLVQHRAMLDVNRLVNSCVRTPSSGRRSPSIHCSSVVTQLAPLPSTPSSSSSNVAGASTTRSAGPAPSSVPSVTSLSGSGDGSCWGRTSSACSSPTVERSGCNWPTRPRTRRTSWSPTPIRDSPYGSLLAGEPRARPARARMRQARQSMSLHVLYFGADRTWPDSPLAHHNMLFARDQRAALRRVFPSRIPRFPRPARDDDVPARRRHVPLRPHAHPHGSQRRPARLRGALRPRGHAGTPEPASDPQAEQARVRAAVLDVLDRKYLPGSPSTSSSSTRSARSTSATSSTRRRVRPSRCNRRCSSRDGSGRTTDPAPSGGSTWSGRGRIRVPAFRLSWPRGRSPQS